MAANTHVAWMRRVQTTVRPTSLAEAWLETQAIWSMVPASDGNVVDAVKHVKKEKKDERKM